MFDHIVRCTSTNRGLVGTWVDMFDHIVRCTSTNRGLVGTWVDYV